MLTRPSTLPLVALQENYTDCRCARKGLMAGYDECGAEVHGGPSQRQSNRMLVPNLG
jgi:hypothetical protein